eukprot:COSAG01_NODE_1421_length_10362_cov_10.007113_7_plen_138_part_00
MAIWVPGRNAMSIGLRPLAGLIITWCQLIAAEAWEACRACGGTNSLVEIQLIQLVGLGRAGIRDCASGCVFHRKVVPVGRPRPFMRPNPLQMRALAHRRCYLRTHPGLAVRHRLRSRPSHLRRSCVATAELRSSLNS